MYLLVKFGAFGNGDINSNTNSYMNTIKKVELTASVHHIERFSKSGIPIYNSRTRLAEKPEEEGEEEHYVDAFNNADVHRKKIYLEGSRY